MTKPKENSVYGWQKIYSLKETKPVAKTEEDYDAKHRRVLEALQPFARAKPQGNLTQVEITPATRATSIVFMLLPEWAHNFPPYNIARLAAITRDAGYATNAFDLNAKAHKDHGNWPGLDFNPWDGSREWRWMDHHYYEYLHKYVEPFLNQYLDKIGEMNPTVVGFSLYYCNQEPTKWMVKELKRRYPHILVMIGGPQCHQSYWQPEPEYDYIITGEGEQLLLEALEEIEAGKNPGHQRWLRQTDGQRLDLDQLPSPDYSYFDPLDYGFPNGVNAELSRGCTAKCVFCSETHFWKYRGRMARNILEEVADLYFNRGVNVIWFLDSLVNGNLNELRAFCKGVIAREMKIAWTGYARCDGRMDLEYYKDLAAAGCISLSYGIESGSTRVLADMDKGVTVEEMEQNLRHGKEVGVEAFSNWIIGFPTETPQDFYESMTFIWRNRNNNLTNVSAGHGFTIPPDTILAQNTDRYNIAKSYFEGNWITKDSANSKVHRLIRLTTFNIFLNNIVTEANIDFTNRSGVNDICKLNFDNSVVREIEYEVFDYNIIKPGLGSFADSLVNEIWPLLRLMWRSRGAYTVDLTITPEFSNREFGDRMGCNFTGVFKFDIDANGHWIADFYYDFVQSDNAWHYSEFSRADSVAARRARKLALPGSGGESQFTNEEYSEEMTLLDERKTWDFSFTHRYNGTGQWQ
jgi:hypothetical protein